jgi:hypothetical protein
LVFWVESPALKDGDNMFHQKVGTYPPSSPYSVTTQKTNTGILYQAKYCSSLKYCDTKGNNSKVNFTPDELRAE